ncbi:helix-turn-helix domain-containing protein [Actinoplanes aureus]|uniref:Helix-turn-helix domain-containing protein n=1 Tax=Actinoplanes aureus TaxID=2792083 RepID=A0A931FZ34_9ACTN|nr:helix-turn-helix domain-containing protein [Actinoplanes aureus]MBG0564300.1 helix-turn-helix domain-containing protein [Actinoplanes aureus]
MPEPIEERLAALESRVARLERGDETLTLLNRLGERADTAEAQDVTGAISYAGAAGFEDRRYLWAKEHEVRDLVAADLRSVATTLESLGSPARLRLLTALLGAPRTRTDLQDVLGETSSGHLYHHLRALHAAGLILQPKRGEYELAAEAVVPLLVILAAAGDLTAPSPPPTGVGP